MKKNSWKIAVLSAAIGMNLLGKWAASGLELPLWLDSVGTGVAASLLGPVFGMACGVICNIIYGFLNPVSFVYGITSAVVGLIIGICVKNGMFSRMFSVVTTSVLVAFASTIVSTPLNLIFWNGTIGNVWGDALSDWLRYGGVQLVIASALGELFVDFPDKVVTVLLTYLIYKNYTNKKKFPGAALCLFAGIWITSFFFFPSLTVYAEESGVEQYAQTIYNGENGLVSGEANAVVETQDGYIWIGTYAGLYRYDGRVFNVMKFDSVKNVNCLYADRKGRLWIGTNDSGISVYENGVVSGIYNIKNGVPSNSIRCIAENGDGLYYIGTSDGLCILKEDSAGEISVDRTVPEISYASSVSVCGDGTAAVVTNAGKLFFLKNETVSGSYTSPDEGAYYTSCLFLKNRSLKIATSADHVYTWDFAKNMPERDSVLTAEGFSYVHAIYETKGGLWVCLDNGIGYFRDGRFYPVNAEGFSASIDNMIQDYQGNLWFASSRLGILKLAQSSFQDLYQQYQLPQQVVNSVAVWQNMLYSGTDAGLDVIDLSAGKKIENALTGLLIKNRIRCLRVDSKNHLWIATSAGAGLLEVMPDGTVRTYGTEQGTVGKRFRSVLELSDGTIAAAENTGIDFIKDGRVVSTLSEKDGLTNPQILSMIEKPDGTLLAGSDGDGIMVIRNAAVQDVITEEDGLSSGVILRMVDIKKGYLIVTSNSLCYMDEKGTITELKDFPYSNNFDVIRASDGKLWVLSSAGVFVVDEEMLLSGRSVNAELLDRRKGLRTTLTANAWDCLIGNTLYLSCCTGVFSINMSDYSGYASSYRMKVDYIDDEKKSHVMTKDSTAQISKNTRRIQILPELLNYTLNDPYVSYCLEGFDKEETTLRQSELANITYTNLQAGNYVFRVSVLDNTGNKILESYNYPLNKAPQFWEHEWFLAYLFFVSALAVMYLTWLFTVLRTNQIIEKQKREIELARQQAKMGNETIQTIAKTVDAKDLRTSQHSARVAEYSVLIARKLGWDKAKCENLRQVALVHDIGKIGIPDSILNKPSRLTKNEYAIMQTHVKIGAQILKDFTLIDHAEDGVLYHHERYDGTGYMKGLRGEEIPLDARIIGIADAFDVMSSDRVYRDHLDDGKTIRELKQGKGSQFDPALVDIFMELIRDGSVDRIRERFKPELFLKTNCSAETMKEKE